jgi:hypothetical protein
MADAPCAVLSLPGRYARLLESRACLVTFAGITVYAIRAFPSRPYVTFGWLWYVISLLPVIGLVQVGSQARGDHYGYVPSLGIFVLADWVMAGLLAHIRNAHPAAMRAWSWAPPAVACGLMLAPTFLAYGQAQFWRDDVTAWERAVAVTPPIISPNIISHAPTQRTPSYKALVHNRECIRLDPNRVEAYDNLAVLPMNRGGYDEAESVLRGRAGTSD